MKRAAITLQTIVLIGVAALLLATPIVSFAQAETPAEDVTARSRPASPEEDRAVRRTRDNNVNTYAEYGAGEAFSLTWPAEAGVRMAYVKWRALPDSAMLLQSDEDGNELSREAIGQPVYNDCYAILPNARKLSLSCESGMRISEVTLYSEGALPEGVCDWQPPHGKADLLVVSAHLDDELLFFGGTIPYYAGERGLAVQVAYMTNADRARVDEALNGLWHAGVRNSPVFLSFRDVYTETLRRGLLSWGEEEATAALVELIRRVRPEVIVTHDLEGEYGHGAHRATAYCALRAVPQAADASAFPDSAARIGAWQAKKLYLHLYPENTITMDWNQPLEAFGGKTALEIANEAYHMHVSQLEYHNSVYGKGEYSSLLYGLAYTAVGADAAKDDFFEHIPQTPPVNTAVPPATPAPAVTPMPAAQTQTPTPTGTPSEPGRDEKQARQPRGIIGIALLLLGTGAAVAIKRRRDRNNGP